MGTRRCAKVSSVAVTTLTRYQQCYNKLLTQAQQSLILNFTSPSFFKHLITAESETG